MDILTSFVNNNNKKMDDALNSTAEAFNFNIDYEIESPETNDSACSIVVTKPDDDKVVNDTEEKAKRLSVLSSSSAESSRSDINFEEESRGSSVFYVVWD